MKIMVITPQEQNNEKTTTNGGLSSMKNKYSSTYIKRYKKWRSSRTRIFSDCGFTTLSLVVVDFTGQTLNQD